MERVLVIGARRSRQGIGGYVARAFHAAGCNVAAVVGTTTQSATQAREELRSCGIDANPYDDLRAALLRERPDIAAICTPYEVHHAQLQLVAEGGAHCLCDKPLWWGPSAGCADETQHLLDAFARAGRYLDVLTQWPETLPTYARLFGRANLPASRGSAGASPSHCGAGAIERFEMRLSPITEGPEMVIDAAPHVLSMVWALVGYGEVTAPQARFAAGGRELTLEFAYHHAAGATAVRCDFVTYEQQPRPAWYGVNGRVAVREIEMSGYAMRLRAQDGSVEAVLPDPLALHIQAFVQDVRRGAATDTQRLVASVVQLARLHEAANRALETDDGNVR